MSRKLTAIKSSGLVLFGSPLLVFALSYHGIGPEWSPLIGIYVHR